MKKKIQNSLFLKVFVITAAALLFMSFFVFGLLAWLMPRTYSNQLSAVLNQQAETLLTELEQVSFQNSGGLFGQFLQNPQISHVELYTDHGTQVPLPTDQTDEDTTYTVMEASTDSFPESSPILSNSYYFSFLGSSTRYMLIVYGPGEQIAEIQRAFIRIFPVLLVLSLLTAFLASLLYSHIITDPVLKISRISQKMSDLQFGWHLDGTRSDELGILEKSLNELSQKLAATISDLQQANQKLAQDIAREKALEQAQADFFSAVSHELKTPITVMKGQLEGMLLGIGAYKDHKKYLARTLEVTAALESMVQEIVTISRLDAAHADLKKERFDSITIIRNYLSGMEDFITQKQLQVFCEMPSEAYLYGNKQLLEKVFSNLIGNAVKYAPQQAEICISVTARPDRFYFSVENSGTHIPEACIPKLFDAFYRVEQSRNRSSGGSGLGLYIVQKILCQHESCCLVRNTASGVQFSFTICSFT